MSNPESGPEIQTHPLPGPTKEDLHWLEAEAYGALHGRSLREQVDENLRVQEIAAQLRGAEERRAKVKHFLVGTAFVAAGLYDVYKTYKFIKGHHDR